MEFRVLDEAVEFKGLGMALFVTKGNTSQLHDGCIIRDSRGNVHTVDSVSDHEGLTCLLIKNGHANYFNRLFRDVCVDATLFVLEDSMV